MNIFQYIKAKLWINFADEIESAIIEDIKNRKQLQYQEQAHKMELEAIGEGSGYWKNTTGHPDNDEWVWVECSPLYEKVNVYVSVHQEDEEYIITVSYDKPTQRSRLLEYEKCTCRREAKLFLEYFQQTYEDMGSVKVDRRAFLYDGS